MIELYSGTPGSGKSLHVSKFIASRLRKPGSIVIGNFYINTGAVKNPRGYYIFCDNLRLFPGRLLKFSRRLSRHLGRRMREGEILLVIDEAQLLFNTRSWQRILGSGWLSFFSQHRHYGFHVILVAQNDRMLDRQVRSLLEYNVIHRKVSNAGTFGFLVGLLFGGNIYIAVNTWYPVREKIDSSFFVGTKKHFALYDSFNHFDSHFDRDGCRD